MSQHCNDRRMQSTQTHLKRKVHGNTTPVTATLATLIHNTLHWRFLPALIFIIQGGSNMTGTVYICLHTNQSRSYLNHLVYDYFSTWPAWIIGLAPFMLCGQNLAFLMLNLVEHIM